MHSNITDHLRRNAGIIAVQPIASRSTILVAPAGEFLSVVELRRRFDRSVAGFPLLRPSPKRKLLLTGLRAFDDVAAAASKEVLVRVREPYFE
jgi:hypothetical protein